MARSNAKGSVAERNEAARRLLPTDAATIVVAVTSDGMLNQLDDVLTALNQELGKREVSEDERRVDRRIISAFRTLLEGGPLEPDDLALPCPEADSVPSAVYTWLGLRRLVEQARKIGGLRIVETRCPPRVVTRIYGLPDAHEDDDRVMKMANAVSTIEDREGVVWFAPTICERLDKTGVETHPDGVLSALAFVAERLDPQDIEPADLRVGSHMIPRFHRSTPEDVVYLPGLNAPSLGGQQRSQLPLFETPQVGGCPSWLLSLYDQAGGTSMSPGQGAPWALRLFVAALLAIPVEARDGLDKRFRLPVGEVARWLHPGGWDRSNRRRDWQAFQAALRSLDELRIPYRVAACSDPDQCRFCRTLGGHLVNLRVVDVPAVPLTWNRGKTPVEIRVAIPESAAMGARVDWERLTEYGLESAVLYRAYLSVCAVLDHSARKGQPITKTIPAPRVDAKGVVIRQRGRILRDSSHRVSNPAARYVGYLGDDQLRRMVGLRTDHPENRKRARAAIERLAQDGVIELDRRGDGTIRFFAPEAGGLRHRNGANR